MAERSEAVRPAVSKRRRILDPSAIVPVPVYSNQVSSSLQMRPTAPLFADVTVRDDALLSPFSRRNASLIVSSDSDEDGEPKNHTQTNERREEPARCPSPPPLNGSDHIQSRKVQQKLNEIDRKLNSWISPESQRRRSRRRRGAPPTPPPKEQDDDVIIVSPTASVGSPSHREIPLKVRCRTDVYKIAVMSSTPLSSVIAQLSVILEVPPPRLLLLRDDVELPNDSSVGELGIGIADIIECSVMAADDSGSDIITVTLQSKEKDSSQEFSLHRETPLGSVFTRFLSQTSASKRRNVKFLFDGQKVSPRQTPAQLDMEDGDIIEVWV